MSENKTVCGVSGGEYGDQGMLKREILFIVLVVNLGSRACVCAKGKNLVMKRDW